MLKANDLRTFGAKIVSTTPTHMKSFLWVI
jgi:hypothetical protein